MRDNCMGTLALLGSGTKDPGQEAHHWHSSAQTSWEQTKQIDLPSKEARDDAVLHVSVYGTQAVMLGSALLFFPVPVLPETWCVAHPSAHNQWAHRQPMTLDLAHAWQQVCSMPWCGSQATAHTFRSMRTWARRHASMGRLSAAQKVCLLYMEPHSSGASFPLSQLQTQAGPSFFICGSSQIGGFHSCTWAGPCWAPELSSGWR